MAKARASLPRRPGRPKGSGHKSTPALVDDILAEWLRTGASPWRLNWAIRAVATAARAQREGITVKSLRERAQDALKKLSFDQVLQRAMEAARERGTPVPMLLRPIMDANRLRDRYERLLEQGREEAEHVRRLRYFCRAFNDILAPDSPISEITSHYDYCRRELIYARQRRQK
jgi:hypothetical protein